MKYTIFIGVDVSKATLDFSVRDQNNLLFHMQVENSHEGIMGFLSRCKSEGLNIKTALFCMEYTGVYNNVLLNFAVKKKYQVWVEQGLQIKRSLGVQRGKNDKVDSARICEYAFRFQDRCDLWQPPRELVIRLKKLTTLRRRLIKTKTLLHQSLCEDDTFEKKQIKREIASLSDPVITKIFLQIKRIDEKINALIKADTQLSGLFEIVTSVDGVGPVTAWELLVTTNEFKRITEAKKFACYSGVVPFEHSSGTSIRGKTRTNRMANKTVKQLLHMSALSSIAMKGELRNYYERKVAEGKNKMTVINAIRNKLVLRIFSCVREGRKYEKSKALSVA